MRIKETPLPELAAALRPHGVRMSYGQLILRASSGMFPVRRERRLVYAIGDPADIARLILHEEEAKKHPRRRKSA